MKLFHIFVEINKLKYKIMLEENLKKGNDDFSQIFDGVHSNQVMSDVLNESAPPPVGLLNDVHRSINMTNGEMFGLISRIRDCVHKVIPFSEKDRKDNDVDSMAAPSFREAMNIEISVTQNNLNSLQAIYEHLQKIIN